MAKNITIYRGGADVSEAEFAMIMLHGRGSNVSDMKSCLPFLQTNNIHIVIPQAPFEIMTGRFAWYRHFWSDNLEQNLIDIQKSFDLIGHCIAELLQHGFKESQLLLFGHSQGANVLLEYFLKDNKAYNCLYALRGCLLGEYSSDRNFELQELPSDTKIYIHSGRQDPYIPPRKVNQTVDLLRRLKATVSLKNFEAAHGICRKEMIDIKKDLDLLKSKT